MPLPALPLVSSGPHAAVALGLAGATLTGLLVGSSPGPPQSPAATPSASSRGGLVPVGQAAPARRDDGTEEAPSRGVWPLQPPPAVDAFFDPPETRWGAGHRGADLVGRPGQPVHAALAGTVSYVGRIAGRGVVTVTHGRLRTTYQPVAASVSRGDEVAEGEVVGRLLLAGSHCYPRACLHWGLLRGDTYLDPLTLVGAVPEPVRLYPW